MKISVLIPSLETRYDALRRTIDVLVAQKAGDPDVEIVVHLDDRTRTLGRKRNDLPQINGPN